MTQNINKAECNCDDPETIENEKALNINVEKANKSNVINIVDPYLKEVFENAQYSDTVNYVQMNVNEIVEEVSKNVIDNVTSSISIIENKSNTQFDNSLVFQLNNDRSINKVLKSTKFNTV